MRIATLVRAGLFHYWRTNLGLVAGSLVATATLVGALVVGDSVRHSLAERAAARLGSVDVVLDAGDRFFRAQLAERSGQPGSSAAPVLRLAGVVSTARGDRRVHDVRVLGVDARFFELGPDRPSGAESPVPPAEGQALMSEALAQRLDLEEGAQLVVRVEKPSALPRDMALAPADTSLALRVTTRGTLSASSFGEFDLSASSSAPLNLFVDLEWLQGELELAGRANTILAAGKVEEWRRHLVHAWSLEDMQLSLLELADGRRELRTPRVFFDHAVARVLRGAPAPLAGVFTYFVNGIEVGPPGSGERSTPYSMVAGVGSLGTAGGEAARPWGALALPAEDTDSIVLNRWAADDLEVGVGDAVSLRYFLVDPARRLVEEERRFTVARIVELEGLAADPGLMPDFPGLADEENCRDWEPGTPVDLDLIRDEDEVYWDDHRGTPKAFVSLAASESLWSNRYGALTAVRFEARYEAALRSALLEGVDPAELGLYFRDVRGDAQAAADSPTDFGGLFVGLSFFLIVAAVLLATQLFLLGVQQRSKEVGLFRAVGLQPRLIRGILFLEATVLAGAGCFLGALLGLSYTRGILRLLAGLWSDAVSGTVLSFHARASTVVTGTGLTFAVVLVTVHLALRARLRQSASELLTLHPAEARLQEGAIGERRTSRSALALVLLSFVGALVLVLAVDPSAGPAAAGAYFGAGALVLAGGLLGLRLLLHADNRRRALSSPAAPRPVSSIGELGLSGTARRPGRSLATVCTMAIGSFLVLAIGSQRQGPTPPETARDTGTGGFAFYGRASLPVVRDLNSARGRESFGLDEKELEDVSIVPLRVRAGDDASCLNLSRVSRPRLVGVDPADLGQRGAFRFTEAVRPDAEPWSMLDLELEGDAVPAVVDATSLAWQLHMGVGDRIEYTDERGEPFEVEIVGAIADSILQGDVLIAERRFAERFPLEGGFRAFLVDAPAARADEVSRRLTRALEDVGLSLEPTNRRLDGFHAVQNGYLAIFQVLGALGLLLGSMGLGTTLLRNTHERRSELAVAGALGFSRRDLSRWILSEYGALLGAGLALGALAALVVVLPAMRGPASDLSLGQVLGLLGLVSANGVLWIAVATRIAVARVPSARLCEE